MNTVNKGKQGEDLAAAYLQKKGYRIWARNVYYQKAEIDIIAQKKDLLCIVEVKYRKSVIMEPLKSLSHQKKESYWHVPLLILLKSTNGKAKHNLTSLVSQE